MSLTNGLAPTPPMGWNSYDFFGGEVTEEEFKANVDYMAKFLLRSGWRYAVIDIAWHSTGNMSDEENNFDAYGRLQPSATKFPSSRGGAGFKPLADYVHSRGMLFGIHVMPGVCRAAIDKSCRVLGTNTPVAEIALTGEFNLLWDGQLHYIKPDHPDGQRYYDSLMRQYADWGVDFIKADGPGFPYRPREGEMLDLARKRAGRPMLLSVSSGCTQYSAYMHHREAHCEMSRISEDFWDRWPQLEAMFDNFKAWRGHSGPGHWADGDMLPLGRIGQRHHPINQPDRKTKFTPHEQRTLMSLYCIAQSPLMLGGDLPSNSPEDLMLITNDEVLYVNQHGSNARELYRDCHHNALVWLADLPETAGRREWAMGVFSFNPNSTRRVPIPWSETGLPPGCRLRDLWEKRDLGQIGEEFVVDIPPHGAAMYRVSAGG